jgi:hypothetical protein
MRNSLFLTIAFVCSYTFILAQSDSLITWDRFERLKLEDFKGKPDKTPVLAITTSGLYFDYSYNTGDSVLVITVVSKFKKNLSWVKPEGSNAKVLKHEQAHFDTAELYARLLKKYYTSVNYTTRMHFDVMLPRMYNEYTSKLNIAQNMYDVETQHGNNTNAQAQYENGIAKQLNDLSQFEKATLTFKLKN